MKSYDISVDIRRRLLSMSMRGFWDIATFDAFADEFARALQTLHRQGGCDYCIVDGSAFAVQSRDVLERFAKVMQDNGPFLAKRTASIVPAELNRLQAARVGENIHSRNFVTRQEAEAWLFGDKSGTGRAA